MCSTTILGFQTTFRRAMILRNYFFMPKSTVVQPPFLARLATNSVFLFSWIGISCPSSYVAQIILDAARCFQMPPCAPRCSLVVPETCQIFEILQDHPRCFQMATSGEPSTWLPLGKLEGQEHLPALIFQFFKNFQIIHFS